MSTQGIYLALYKGQAKSRWERWQDKVIRFFTKGKYSHCEIAVKKHHFEPGDRCIPIVYYDCYSSSPREGGVRCKQLNLHESKWDLIPLNALTESQIIRYFNRTSGAKYDWWGVLGLILGIRQKRSRFFCSEWCFNVIFNSDEGWRFSPNQLAVIFKKGLN